MKRLLLVDNRDSFTYNIYALFSPLAEVEVVSAFEPCDTDAHDAVIVSAGPGDPRRRRDLARLVSRLGGVKPVLGVCLGHQVLGLALGGVVRRTPPVHGRAVYVEHRGSALFAGLPKRLRVARYNSLIVEGLDERFVSARDDAGRVMALSAPELAYYGVQFHPDSFLSEGREGLARNFLRLV